MIKQRHVGRANQKRKSWRAQKGNLKEEEAGCSEMEGWSERKRDAGNFGQGYRGKQEEGV